jgi:hypothetical protein
MKFYNQKPAANLVGYVHAPSRPPLERYPFVGADRAISVLIASMYNGRLSRLSRAADQDRGCGELTCQHVWS